MKKRTPVAKLTHAERRYESEIGRGEWGSLAKEHVERYATEFQEYARQRKEARVNLRLNPDDVARIRVKAQREGVPYQTLIASVLHKYATNQLVDHAAVRDAVRHLS